MKTIVIDAGHGGNDPGAVIGSIKEKTLVLDIAKSVSSYLIKHYDCRVIQTRPDDQFKALDQRTDQANAAKADCLVSVHVNAAADSRANGFESFVYTTDDESSKSVALQKQLHKRLAKIWTDEGRSDRGMKKANFHMVREFKGAAVLVELGFLSNLADASLLQRGDFRHDNAVAIAKGIAENLKLSKKEEHVVDPVYRVKIDGVQIGAYRAPDNTLAQIEKAINAGRKRIVLERI